jgi:hypothetical protein
LRFGYEKKISQSRSANTAPVANGSDRYAMVAEIIVQAQNGCECSPASFRLGNECRNVNCERLKQDDAGFFDGFATGQCFFYGNYRSAPCAAECWLFDQILEAESGQKRGQIGEINRIQTGKEIRSGSNRSDGFRQQCPQMLMRHARKENAVKLLAVFQVIPDEFSQGVCGIFRVSKIRMYKRSLRRDAKTSFRFIVFNF